MASMRLRRRSESARPIACCQLQCEVGQRTHKLGTVAGPLSDDTVDNLVQAGVRPLVRVRLGDGAVDAPGDDSVLKLAIWLLLERGGGTESKLDGLVALAEVEIDLGAEEGGERPVLGRKLGELGVRERLDVGELFTDLGPELGDDCEEVLEGVDADIAVLVLEQGERAGWRVSMTWGQKYSPALVVTVATVIVAPAALLTRWKTRKIGWRRLLGVLLTVTVHDCLPE